MLPEPSAAAVLGWIARGRAIACKSYHGAAVDWLAMNNAPAQAQRIVKSPVGAGSTVNNDLGDYGVGIGAWSDAARTTSAFYRVWNDNGFVKTPMRTRVGITTMPAVATVVGEGVAVPVSPIQLQNVMLEPIGVSSLTVVTDELLRDISGPGQALLSRALIAAVSSAVDAAFIGLLTDTSSPPITSSGPTADLRAALLAVNTVGTARLYWIAAPDVAKLASTLSTADSGPAFAAASAAGGELANLPLLVSSGLADGTLLLLDASGIAADGGPVTVTASANADVLMDTAPAMNSTTPTAAQMTSMFQSNSTALKATAWFAAQKIRDDAAAVVTGITGSTWSA